MWCVEVPYITYCTKGDCRNSPQSSEETNPPEKHPDNKIEATTVCVSEKSRNRRSHLLQSKSPGKAEIVRKTAGIHSIISLGSVETLKRRT